MKRSPDFLLRQVADTLVIVPVGPATATFPGMIHVNETGAFLWGRLETEQTLTSLAQALAADYEVSLEQAREDTRRFLQRLISAGAVLES